MKCIVCGKELNTTRKNCSACGASKGLTAYRALFAWTDNDIKNVKEMKNKYNNDEQRRIQEENRKLEEQRKADQKLAEERKATEAKRLADEKRKEEQKKIDEERIRAEQDRLRKEEIERQATEQTEKKSKKRRNIIIAVIIFLIIGGIGSNLEQSSNYIPSEPVTDATSTTSNYNSSENVIEYINNDWSDERIALYNWEVPYKAYNQYVENCTKFTLDFSITDVTEGNPYGVWIVYLRDKNGKWNEITTFAHSKNHGEETASVDIKVPSYLEGFDAIALARKSDIVAHHSFGYNTRNFVIAN